jgi:hypothetical protein
MVFNDEAMKHFTSSVSRFHVRRGDMSNVENGYVCQQTTVAFNQGSHFPFHANLDWRPFGVVAVNKHKKTRDKRLKNSRVDARSAYEIEAFKSESKFLCKKKNKSRQKVSFSGRERNQAP